MHVSFCITGQVCSQGLDQEMLPSDIYYLLVVFMCMLQLTELIGALMDLSCWPGNSNSNNIAVFWSPS